MMAWPSGSRGREAAKPAAAAAPPAAAPAAAAAPVCEGVCGGVPEMGEFVLEPSGEFAPLPRGEPMSDPLSKRSG